MNQWEQDAVEMAYDNYLAEEYERYVADEERKYIEREKVAAKYRAELEAERNPFDGEV